MLRCNWIRCIKPTLLFPSVKHNVLNYVGHFCFHYYMYNSYNLFSSSDDVKQAQEKTVMG